MKKFNIQHAIAPVIALFAVGCSSPVAMQSTEYDDMYYSSSDRTEYVQPQAQAMEQQYAPAGESAQNAQSATGDVTQDYYADEYYDGRTYRPQATWNTPNYAYVDPYWTTAHVRRMNRFNAFHDPFFYDPFMMSMYDPFMYDPFFPRNRFMVSMSFGHGWGGGWNRWGHPYGMGMGMHDPFWGGGFWPHNSYYAGFHHGFNRGFYGGNRFIYDRPVVVQPRQVQYGPREGRSGVPATGSPDRVTGRPARTQTVTDEQRSTQSVDYARPSRTGRTTGTSEIRGEQTRQVEGRQVLPARPSRQQPAGQQPVQRVDPAREGSVQPAQRQQRIQQQPVQRQERVQPAQRSQPSYQRSQPAQRSQPSYQRSQPVQRSQPSYSPPSRSSGTSSPPARSSGGGRPGRGGN